MYKNRQNTYRDNGAIGALLDEYERAIQDLKTVLETISEIELQSIVDTQTPDEDCRSIQTILTHVVRSGYGYAIYVRKAQGETLNFRTSNPLNTITEYIVAMDEMFAYNAQLFEDYPNLKIEELKMEKKIVTNWQQHYDIEQLFEHAIVHILRHRRQIERFLLKLR
jgi:DinB family